MKIWVLLFSILWQSSDTLEIKTSPDDQPARVDQLNELSKIALPNNPFEALDYSDQALKLAESIKYDRGIAYALNNIGVVHNNIGNLDKALDYFLRSWRIHQAINNQDGVASSLNNIGTIYSSKEDYDKALNYFIRALEIVQNIPDTTRIIGSLNNIGNIHLARNEVEQAEQYYKKSWDLYRHLPNQYRAFDPYTNLGNVHFQRGVYDSALYHYQQSLAIESANENVAGQAQACHNLGVTYNRLGENDLALEYQFKALEMAQVINSKPLIMTIYKSLSDIYFDQKNWFLAKDYLLWYGMVKDSIYNEQSNRKIADLERTYELEEREREIELLKKESQIQRLQLKNNRNSILAIVFGSAVLFSIAIFYYLKHKSSQKTRALLASKNREITESIKYAQSVQQAILDRESIQKSFPESFIFFRPKDIVSGDFYWHCKLNGWDILATVDCTGHGVAGAFMTVIGNSLLNQIIVENQEADPARILEQLDIKLKETLKERQVDLNKHGMDIAICRIDKRRKTLTFAGARSDLYTIKGGSFEEIKGDRHTIGENINGSTKSFRQHQVSLNKNDLFYLSSDGFADQFGENPNKKFMKKSFKELLTSIWSKPLSEQEACLDETLNAWQGTQEQTDDILVMGIRCN